MVKKKGGTTHVVPNSTRGGWDVKRGGVSRAEKHFDRKQDAVDYGRQRSRARGDEFHIHKKDGTIGKKDSHGGDDFPPRG
jgi:hypothetical protein